jgi:1,4-dihydroxy-2-naphthoate octaprenyltransferase
MDTTYKYSTNLPGDNERQKAILAIKFLLFSASVIPAIVGGSIAWYYLTFNWIDFIMVVAGLFIGQAGGDYLYYYFTHFHTDSRDSHTKIFAGWKPLFTGTLIKPKETLFFGIFCLVVDLGIGVYFFTKLGWMILLLAGAGGLIAVFFTPLMLRGLKEPVIFLTFGPLCVIGAVYVMTGEFKVAALVASLPIGFLVTVVAYLKGAKFQVMKENGNEIIMNLERNVIYQLIILAYLTLGLNVALGHMPLYSIAGIVSLPISLSVVRVIKSGNSEVKDYLWAVVKAILALIITGLLIALGYVLQY